MKNVHQYVHHYEMSSGKSNAVAGLCACYY